MRPCYISKFLFRDAQQRRHIRTFVTNTTPTAEHPLKGYKKYAQQFKNKPGSYMTSFAILHEVTAIVPFPLIYYMLDYSSVNIPFPDSFVVEGNKAINKIRKYYGYESLESDNKVMMHLVTTYCVVKALLPLRIAASVAMTPFFAESIIGPILNYIPRQLKIKRSI
ncbi:hypothetical protein BDB01DRAFT_724004 [Pilobolus umbonatus]|nr:hypothetical protein BDB01DRAFT_724004 [Pilobolus umbonatus]